MSGQPIAREELVRLFKAARWAPSSFNAQQWRALYARRETEHWSIFFNLLGAGNQSWAKNAAALVVFVSRINFDHNEELSVTHSYDCGAAWQNFALQGFSQGLVVHGMEGFDYERARSELRVPEPFQSKRWLRSAGEELKKCFRKNCSNAKALTIAGLRRRCRQPSKVSESICEGRFAF